jgi:hypothetical protein
LNPGTAQFPLFPNVKPHCATQFFEGLFNPRLAPGQSFQYKFTKDGEYFYNDCTDPRPTGKVVAYHVPQDMPGALRFDTAVINMKAVNGVFASVHGQITAMFRLPAGYTFDGGVRIKTPLSAVLFPAISTHVAGGNMLIARFDKALLDNNMPADEAVPLVVTVNVMHDGVQKQLSSTANVRVMK